MRQALAVVFSSFVVSGSGSGALGQPVKVGGEFQVNAYTVGEQYQTSVAGDSAGDFVVVWTSNEEDGDRWGVFGQRYDSSGSLQGSPFQVNSYTTYHQYRSSAAMDADGDFVVAWASLEQDGDHSGIFVRRFDSSGTAHGVELQVNTYTTSSQNYPAVAMDGDGDFVVVWQSNGPDGYGQGIFGQRFDSTGLGLGGEFQVNSYTIAYQERPAVAMADDGDFVVVWHGEEQDGSNRGIFGQRFAAAGAALGAEFQVNSFTPNTQLTASVAMDGDGDFVVVWTSYYQDGSSTGVFAQRFDSSGTALGVELRANSHTIGGQRRPSVSMDDAGDFVVVWNSYYQDGYGAGVFGQVFDSAGVASGGEFLVNTYTLTDQGLPSAAMDAGGDFVVAWVSARRRMETPAASSRSASTEGWVGADRSPRPSTSSRELDTTRSTSRPRAARCTSRYSPPASPTVMPPISTPGRSTRRPWCSARWRRRRRDLPMPKMSTATATSTWCCASAFGPLESPAAIPGQPCPERRWLERRSRRPTLYSSRAADRSKLPGSKSREKDSS